MFSSQRGNTILAALAFVGLLGVTSIALSSLQTQGDLRGQTADAWYTQQNNTQQSAAGTQKVDTPGQCKPGQAAYVNVKNGKQTVFYCFIDNECNKSENAKNPAKCPVQCPVFYCNELAKDAGGTTCKDQNPKCGEASGNYVKAQCLIAAEGSNSASTAGGGSQCVAKDIKNSLVSERALGDAAKSGTKVDDIPLLEQKYQECTSASTVSGDTCQEAKAALESARARSSGDASKSLDDIIKAGEDKNKTCPEGDTNCPAKTPDKRAPGYDGPNTTGGLDRNNNNNSNTGGLGRNNNGFGGNNGNNGNQSTFGNSYDNFNCSITASPSQINPTQQNGQQQQQQPVTLRWQSSGGTQQNPPYQAVIYAVGTMGPNGSTVVYPQQTTTYNMRVYGYTSGTADCQTTVTVGQNNPYGTGTDGRPCSQPPAQPSASSCSSGTWKPVSSTGNGCTTGYQCVPNSSSQPGAELTCQPASVDEGMPLGIAWGCSNSTYAEGGGFSVKDGNGAVQLSGTLQTAANSASTTYAISCGAATATTTAQCVITVAKPTIVFTSVPDKVAVGETVTLGWVTSSADMNKCTVASTDFSDFTQQQKDITPLNGTVKTPAFSKAGLYDFTLKCDTKNGGTKTATTTVTVTAQ